ncbi:arsenate reductase family protein [Clostridium cylindrosporum]|uniref:Transcriptional regulator, Spx/MgsR family n=1 Tax=Clostridium cylindrosporum DSM 605 TaxID=1121307 RepID=A0A0J8G1J0_CLOCY|nr:arsenate reductase family protein [Clostridium cylindrosporum]KMT21626.1 transcriptional regulator, Spx/MgsR family [Clostridium cylindrosporum DSM 605]
MKGLFIEYPKCSTCKKAKTWLVENNVQFEERHIVDNNPSKEELSEWIEKSNFPIKKFFNTSGILYREMNLKDKINDATKEELISILSENGMLVKRPIFLFKDKVLVGFKEAEYEELIK